MNHGVEKVIIKVCRFHCESCSRFDAREDDTGGWWNFHKKPKPGQTAHCWMNDYKIDWRADQLACEYWTARWWWNFLEYRRYVKYYMGRWWFEHVRKRVGGLRRPVPLRWVDYFDGMRDEIVTAGEPQCPRCGEMPYSTIQCQFCGQRFTVEKENAID